MVGIEDHIEKSKSWRHKLSGSRSASLKEKLDGDTLFKKDVKIGLKGIAISAISGKMPADEKTAQFAKESPDGEDIEIDPPRYMNGKFEGIFEKKSIIEGDIVQVWLVIGELG